MKADTIVFIFSIQNVQPPLLLHLQKTRHRPILEGVCEGSQPFINTDSKIIHLPQGLFFFKRIIMICHQAASRGVQKDGQLLKFLARTKQIRIVQSALRAIQNGSNNVIDSPTERTAIVLTC